MKKLICFLLMLTMLLAAGCAPQKPSDERPQGFEASGEETPNTGMVEVRQEFTPESYFSFDAIDDANCEITGCSYDGDVIRVPETIAGLTVVGIGRNGFATVEAEKIILPDTVEYIQGYAFNTCEDLEEVDLGNGLKWIGRHAFSVCEDLECVEFPDGMSEIKGEPFIFCESLKEVVVPASVTTIDDAIVNPGVTGSKDTVIITPAGSAAEANAAEYNVAVKNN